MIVELSSVGNPDHRQNPYAPLFGCEKDNEVRVQSFKQASEACRSFIDNNDLGSGNWSGGDIYDDERQSIIAYVSYNGNVWRKGKEGKELLFGSKYM